MSDEVIARLSLPTALLSCAFGGFGMCAYLPVQAAEIRIYEMENVLAHNFEIESKGRTPKPSLVIINEQPSSFRSNTRLPNLEINSDTSNQWHIYADITEFQHGGYGLVNKHLLLFGFAPVTVAIPSEYALSIRTTLLGVGYKIGGNSRVNWGVTTGVEHYDASLSLMPTEPNQEGLSGTAHITLPMLGTFLDAKVTDKIAFHMRFQGTTFGTHLSDKRVRTSHLRAGVDWQMNSTMALGLGYQHSTFDYFSQGTAYQSHYGAETAATSAYLKLIF